MKIDWLDRIYIDTFPEESRDYKFWPTKPTSFREVMVDYCLKMKVITTQLNKAVARSLGLDEDCFVKQFGGEKEGMLMSWNYYPPCPNPELILGLRPHTDGTGYSILLNDDVGLQVGKDDKWYHRSLMLSLFFWEITWR